MPNLLTLLRDEAVSLVESELPSSEETRAIVGTLVKRLERLETQVLGELLPAPAPGADAAAAATAAGAPVADVVAAATAAGAPTPADAAAAAIAAGAPAADAAAAAGVPVAAATAAADATPAAPAAGGAPPETLDQQIADAQRVLDTLEAEKSAAAAS